MRYAPTTGYVRGFKKWICICHRRWRMVGRIRYAPTTGYVRSFEIPMQFSNWVRTILRNTDAISRLGTCGPSKNYPVFVPFGVAGWGVCNTPLRLGTCDLSKYRCNSPTGYVRSFEIPMRFSNWVRAILRNTDAIPQPGTCAPSKYRYDLSTGGAGIFGRWGDGGYRLRGRQA